VAEGSAGAGTAAEAHSQFKFPVFQAGPRVCLGMQVGTITHPPSTPRTDRRGAQMAYLEVKVLAVRVLQHFQLSLDRPDMKARGGRGRVRVARKGAAGPAGQQRKQRQKKGQGKGEGTGRCWTTPAACASTWGSRSPSRAASPCGCKGGKRGQLLYSAAGLGRRPRALSAVLVNQSPHKFQVPICSEQVAGTIHQTGATREQPVPLDNMPCGPASSLREEPTPTESTTPCSSFSWAAAARTPFPAATPCSSCAS
jgi:hypothetical protein